MIDIQSYDDFERIFFLHNIFLGKYFRKTIFYVEIEDSFLKVKALVTKVPAGISLKLTRFGSNKTFGPKPQPDAIIRTVFPERVVMSK